MNEGLIEQVGTPEDIYLRPQPASSPASSAPSIGSAASAFVPKPSACCAARPPTTAIAVPGVVTGSVFLGDCVQVLVRLDSGEDAVAQLPRHAACFQPGDAVHFTWNAADEMTFS